MQQLAKGAGAGRSLFATGRFIANTTQESPCCGEIAPRGNQCRWNDEISMCRHPNHARAGTVYRFRDGREWYLTAKRGGYSGGHTIYALHRPDAASQDRGRRVVAAPAKIDLAGLLQQAKGVRDAVARVRAQLSLEHATLEELRAYERALRMVEQRLGAFDEALRDVRVTNPKVTQLRAAVADWKRQLRYARADMDRFMAHLGTPTRAEVGA